MRHPEWSAKWLRLLALLPEGPVVVLAGDRGNGKTQMAVEAMRMVCREDKSAAYIKRRHFTMKLREAYDDGGRMTELNAIQAFVRPHLLVIDECHDVVQSRDFERLSLIDLVDERYGAERPTILIINEQPDRLLPILGDSIMDRINEGGAVIHFNWPSFRGSSL